MGTNANSTALAAALKDAKKGTFTGIIYRKLGEERGRGADRKVYGDDLVHDVIITGFRYRKLCQRSADLLKDISLRSGLEICDGLTGWEDGVKVPVGTLHVWTALKELWESLQKSERGDNLSTNHHVFEPLVVDDEVVRGCRVYTEPRPGREPAAPKGTIYLQGLRIGRTVLEAAPNGPIPPAVSHPVVVAKNAIRKQLPIRRYVSYRLVPGGDWLLRTGGSAAAAATEAGVTLSPKAVQQVQESLLAA